MNRYCLPLLLMQLNSCDNANHANPNVYPEDVLKIIKDIKVPEGYERVSLSGPSFGNWLRNVSLKNDNKVYLYDGRLKRNQTVQYAVLDISVGKKDLQQCADAIMRLRAEFWMAKNMPDSIAFVATNGQLLSYAEWRKGVRYKLAGNRITKHYKTLNSGEEDKDFMEYMEFVFTYCGTLSLHRQLKPVKDLSKIQPGDIWIKPGSPGHAMIVIDVVSDKAGNKQFMLAQSYMPAQDIHIVVNPLGENNSPWYPVQSAKELITPEWTFEEGSLYTW